MVSAPCQPNLPVSVRFQLPGSANVLGCRLQNDKTGRVRQSVSHDPRIRSAPAEIRRVAGPPPPHPPSDCVLSQGVAMCRGSRTPTRETRRVRSKRVPGRASDQRPPHQTRRRPATAAPVPGTRRSVTRPSPLPALVALRFQVHPTSSSLVSRQGPRLVQQTARHRPHIRSAPAEPGRAAGPPSSHLSSGQFSLTSRSPDIPFCVLGRGQSSRSSTRAPFFSPGSRPPAFRRQVDASPRNGSPRCPSVASNDPQAESFEICGTPSFSVSESLDLPSPSGPWLETLNPPDCCQRKLPPL